MATHLTKSDPGKLAFRFSTLGATLQAAQDFAVIVDVQFGGMEHARYRAGEGGMLVAPDGSWVPGARFAVLAERDGGVQRRGLLAVPEADADHHLGLAIGGFTIGADGHPDPASAWDLSRSEDLPHEGNLALVEQTAGLAVGEVSLGVSLRESEPEVLTFSGPLEVHGEHGTGGDLVRSRALRRLGDNLPLLPLAPEEVAHEGDHRDSGKPHQNSQHSLTPSALRLASQPAPPPAPSMPHADASPHLPRSVAPQPAEWPDLEARVQALEVSLAEALEHLPRRAAEVAVRLLRDRSL